MSSRNRIEFCEPTDLYNILQQTMKSHPCLADASYLLLLDARSKSEYNESHIITSKRVQTSASGEFLVPYDSELECKMHVVVLDNETSIAGAKDSAAVQCAMVMSAMGSRNPVKILNGGYKEFSALYPFLRTQKIIYMPRELDQLEVYPIEITRGRLYLGDCRQACRSYVRKDLKVRGVVCVSMGEYEELVKDMKRDQLMLIQVPDDDEADLMSFFRPVCKFVAEILSSDQAVLVCSDSGLSRSACIILACRVLFNRISVKNAHSQLLRCNPSIRLQSTFMEQLEEWQKSLFVQ